MASLANTCEGTNGGTITNANTAGPNQFDSILGTGALTYDTAHPHRGSTGLHHIFTANVSAPAKYPTWSTSISPTPVSQGFGRLYLYLTAWPTVLHNLMQLHTGTAVSCTASINASGQLRISNSSGTSIGTTTGTFPLNTPVRVEFDLTNIAGTTGDVAARMFSGSNLEGVTPDTNGTVSSAGAAVAGTLAQCRFGSSSSVTMTANYDLWYDDCAWSDTATPGPVVGAPLRSALQAVARAGAW